MPEAITTDGWCHPVRRIDSPNHNERPPGVEISLLVIHNISLPPDEYGGGFIERFFCNQLPGDAHPYFASICQMTVSAHCLVDRRGGLTQFVSFDHRAWHAGQSNFQGLGNCNDYSIGIELEGSDHVPYTAAQYQTLTHLTHLLRSRYPAITPQRITGHSDIAPGRKTDPGPVFDWRYYRAQLDA